MAEDLIKPYGGDPFAGNLSTPISDSSFTRAFIANLPINRKGLSPIARGLEIGLAHGYFLVGPEVIFGTNRDFAAEPYLAALLTAIVIVLLGAVGMGAHGLVSLKSAADLPADTPALKTSEGWSELATGFFLGGMGSAFLAYFFLEHLSGLDAILRGFVN